MDFDNLKKVLSKKMNPAWVWVLLTTTLLFTFITYNYLVEPKFIPEQLLDFSKKVVNEVILGEENWRELEDNETKLVDTKNEDSNEENDDGEDTNTSSWLTYENKDLGFSLDYSNDLIIKEDFTKEDNLLGYVSFWEKSNYGKNEPGFFSEYDIEIYSNSVNLSVDDWLRGRNDPTGIISNREIVRIGEVDWIKAEEGGDPDHLIYVNAYENKVYLFITSMGNASSVENVLEEFKTI